MARRAATVSVDYIGAASFWLPTDRKDFIPLDSNKMLPDFFLFVATQQAWPYPAILILGSPHDAVGRRNHFCRNNHVLLPE